VLLGRGEEASSRTGPASRRTGIRPTFRPVLRAPSSSRPRPTSASCFPEAESGEAGKLRVAVPAKGARGAKRFVLVSHPAGWCKLAPPVSAGSQPCPPFRPPDELIARKSRRVRRPGQEGRPPLADKEEEIRIEVEKPAGLHPEGGRRRAARQATKFTVAKGRVDSVYSRVLIEYKNPCDSGARQSANRADSPGCKKVVEQIKSRFPRPERTSRATHSTRYSASGLDGNHFVFVRFPRTAPGRVQEPAEVNRHFRRALPVGRFSTSARRAKPFSPEYLAGDFGANENLRRHPRHPRAV